MRSVIAATLLSVAFAAPVPQPQLLGGLGSGLGVGLGNTVGGLLGGLTGGLAAGTVNGALGGVGLLAPAPVFGYYPAPGLLGLGTGLLKN